MARPHGRGRKSKPNKNQIAAVIYGLRPNGDIARISAYDSGDSVRLSGPNSPHWVHGSNVSTVEGWQREAVLVWRLTNAYNVHPASMDSDDAKERYAELQAKSAELKRQLAERPKPSAS